MGRKILIASGGTGGHLFPAQQLAEMLKEDSELLFAGNQLSSSPFFQKEKIPFVEISAHPLKWGFFRASWKGFWQSLKMMRHFAPDVVVGFGSYHTFPVLLAAAILRKKIILFEANCVLGKVNRLFSSAAVQIAFQFPVCSKKGVRVHWLPWIKQKKKATAASLARKAYGLDPDRKTILIFGGSQGASFLNEIVPSLLASFKEPLQAIHLTGDNGAKTENAYLSHGISAWVQPFEKKMSLAYSAANVAICRSGAGTIAELLRFAVPSLLIPYPHASEDHQRKNGEYLVSLGGARLLNQKEASKKTLAKELEKLLSEEKLYRARLKEAFRQQQQTVHLSEIVRECHD